MSKKPGQQSFNWRYWIGIFLVSSSFASSISGNTSPGVFPLLVRLTYLIVGIFLFWKGSKIQKKRKKKVADYKKSVFEKKCTSCGYYFDTKNKKQSKCNDCRKKR